MVGSNYWNRTDEIVAENGGQGPPCGYCGKPTYPIDDHGRFGCTCDGYKAHERRLLKRNPF